MIQKIRHIIAGCIVLLGVAACEKDLPVYESKTCQLNFKYGTQDIDTDDVTDDMRALSHSFILNSETGVEIDTVWITVTTMGYLSGENRPFVLEQILTGENDAVAGKHYVSFDDAELKAGFYFIPANQAEKTVPIVVIKDASLNTGDVTLKFTFRENDFFQLGYPEFSLYTLTISDKLTKPNNWATCSLDSYFGGYGSQKHELMIQWTEEAWDETYINSLFYGYEFSDGTVGWFPKDDNYINYLSIWFAEKLEEENAKRLTNPEIGDVYRESNGDPVDFTPL